MPEVSIIIPNHNYARYIGDALKSVSAQTMQDWECIVIDDASTDNSVEIIQQHIKSDPRFKLIRMKNKSGTSVARNAGLDIARGEYIAFLDSDDCFTQYALEMLVNLARCTNADMVGGGTNIVPHSFKLYIPNTPRCVPPENFGTYPPGAFLLNNPVNKWCWIWRRIYKREMIGTTRFLPEMTSFGDDLIFMLNIFWRARIITETPTTSVFHRAHAASITGTEFSNKNFDFFPAYFKHAQNNILDKYDTLFLKTFYRNSFSYLLMETLFKPHQIGTHQARAVRILIAASKYIPREYLTLKQRIVCRFLQCLK